MIRTIRSGKVVERSKFFCGPRKPRGDRKKGSTTLAKKDQNMQQAGRRLARVMNCNFGPEDLLVTLTYGEEALPASPKEAAGCVAKFIRRLKYLGMQVAGIWITADKDKNGKPERLHHHMVLKADAVTLEGEGEAKTAMLAGKSLEQIWGMGYVHAEHLRQQDDYTPLAAYLIRQAASGPDEKKWHASRGLAQPVVEEEKLTQQPGALRAPAGAQVLEVGAYDEATGSHYMRYIRRPKSRAKKETEFLGLDWIKGPYADEGDAK